MDRTHAPLWVLVTLCIFALFITAPVAAKPDTFCDVPLAKPPLLEAPRGKVDYRVGKPFTDGGDA